MIKIFLDDIRFPERVFGYTGNKIYNEKGWNIVRTYDKFIWLVEKLGVPDIVSFDHDLTAEHDDIQIKVSQGLIKEIPYSEFKEKTGYDCAKWLFGYCGENNIELPKTILCHSMNPVGRNNILKIFKNGNI